MFGHILRSPENSPASLALSFAVEGSKNYHGLVGRHRVNLLSTLKDDLKKIPVSKLSNNIPLHKKFTLTSQNDINYIRSVAENRVEWNKLFVYVDRH